MKHNNLHLTLDRKLSLTLCVLAALALTFALAAVPGQARGVGCKGAGKAPAQLSPSEISRATVCVLNRIRSAHGLRPLRADASLRRAAFHHSNDMVRRDFFSHDSPGGSSMQTRIGGSGYLVGAGRFLYGEVIGGGTAAQGSPKVVARAWMGSAPHRAAILTGRFRDLGVGAVHGFPGSGSRGATYTVDFGVRR